ncbi:monofunctional biosynthetic peptidoglycan transglycosylase [Alsobacter sp. SYSU M60028]|uniref:Biosynthetic peptidoglycan transglycosylase n=1 Tax=Alsobacter ponti TaxID=2962936 RepID=A0ABT1LDU9_9HYPH|nr:monofunctional biosynthetic peptidoglycan transglycosylase [Alsobacter ponti]MCP8938900.1 monofunctional biosynthetic peptidoglycan transglycosylase [Alsobacter ponti]
MGARGTGGVGWRLRRVLRWAFYAVLAIVALVLALSVAWRFVPPVSTLMLGRWLTFQSVDRSWTPLGRISPRLVAAVMMSEDARFCEHGGVDWDALREVIADAEDGAPSRGASTLTMQTAKNLFLWPSRSYVRKGLEIPLALWLDLVWPKKRIMEVYLNIAEWGPGVFGAEAAARAAFNKPAAALSAREAALLATALPNPIRRDSRRPSRGHQRLAAIVAGRAAASEPYTECVR